MKNKLENVAKLLGELSGAVMEIAAEVTTEEVEIPPKAEIPSKAEIPLKAEKAVEETKGPTLEEVRTILAEISRAGNTAEMRALLSKFGATKLSDINPEDYPALLKAAQEVSNA